MPGTQDVLVNISQRTGGIGRVKTEAWRPGEGLLR